MGKIMDGLKPFFRLKIGAKCKESVVCKKHWNHPFYVQNKKSLIGEIRRLPMTIPISILLMDEREFEGGLKLNS